MKGNKWYVYILLCSDDTYYTGVTNNLDKRIKSHNNKTGSKYTRGRVPVMLVYQMEMEDKSSALKEEYRIKKLSRADKLRLIYEADGPIDSILS